MTFFTALIGTCKDTKVFTKLLSQSLGRAFWHLCILATICSLFILMCTYSKNAHKIDKAFAQMEETFGDIQVNKNGITPKNINEKKSFLVADNSQKITYLPSIGKGDLSEIDADDVNSGLLWTPTMFAPWLKIGPDNFLLIPFACYSNKQLSPESIKRSAIASYIKDNTFLKGKFVCYFPELSWSTLNDYYKNMFIPAEFFGNLFGILLQVLFFIMMFSFILNLSAKNTNNPVLKYRTRFTIGIYVSFPPLLIATMFRAFELPLLSFSSVYIICFSIYLIVVFTRLQLDFNAQTPDKTE